MQLGRLVGGLALASVAVWLGLSTLQAQGNLPDLAVKEIKISPSSLEEGDSAQIRTIIVNQGRADAIGPFDILIELNGRELGYRSIFELKAQQSVELRLPWKAIVGEHRVTVYVDTPFGRVRESNESNNTRSLVFQVAPLSAVRSLTLDTVKVFTRALDFTGEALKFQLTEAIFSSIENANNALQQGAAALREAATELHFVRAPFAADWLSAQTQSHEANALLLLFDSLSESMVRIGGTLSIGNFEGVLEHSRTFRKTFADLTARQIETTSFQVLQIPLEQFNRVIALATELRNLLQGAPGRPQLEVATELFGAFTKFGELLRVAAQTIVAQAQAQSPRFLDTNGQPLNSTYRSGQPIVIEIPNATQITFEVYGGTGPALRHTSQAAGPLFQWNGVDSGASSLPPGVYFYRLVAQMADGRVSVELGQLRIVQASEHGDPSL